MSSKKQTAMMELLSIINGVLEYSHNPLLQQISDAGNKLLEKEWEQIIDAYDKGVRAGMGDYIDTIWGNESKELTSNQYYNETYGGNNV